MKQHTTNYVNTFIEVAEDCPATTGTIPPDKTPKTAARIALVSVNSEAYNEFVAEENLHHVKAMRERRK